MPKKSQIIDWNQFDDAPESGSKLIDWNQFDEHPIHSPGQTTNYFDQFDEQPVQQAPQENYFDRFDAPSQPMQSPTEAPAYHFAQAPEPMAPAAVQYNEPAGPMVPPAPTSMRDRAIGVLSRELPKTARSFDLYANIADATPAIQEARQAEPGEYWKQLGEGGMYGMNQLIDAAQYFTQLPARVPAAAFTLNSDFLFPKGTEPDAIDSLLGRRNNAYKWKEEHPASLPATYDVGKYLSQMILPGGLGSKATTYGGSIGLGALEGAGQGFVTGVADQMSDGKFDPLGLALNTGLGAGFGGAAGGIGQFLGRVFPKKGVPGAAPADPSLPPDVPPDPPGGGMNPYFAHQMGIEPQSAPAAQSAPMLSGRVEASQAIPEPETSDVLARLGLKSSSRGGEPQVQAQEALPSYTQPAYDWANHTEPNAFFGQNKRFVFGQPGRGNGREVLGQFANELDKDMYYYGTTQSYYSGKNPRPAASEKYPYNTEWFADALSKRSGIPKEQLKARAFEYNRQVNEAMKSGADGDALVAPSFKKGKPRVRMQLTPANADLPPAAQTPSSYTPKETGMPEIPGVTPSKAPLVTAKFDLLGGLGLKRDDADDIFRQRRKSFGRNKVDEALDASRFSPEASEQAHKILQAKTTLDYRTATLNDYRKKLWDRLKDEGLVSDADTSYSHHDGTTVSRTPIEVIGSDGRLNYKALSSNRRSYLEKQRFDLASPDVDMTGNQHVSAVLGSAFGRDGKFGAKHPDVPVPNNLDDAFRVLRVLHNKTLSESKKAPGAKGLYDEAKAAAFDKSTQQGVFRDAQDLLRKDNPTAHLNIKGKVRAPFGEQIEGAVSLDYNPSSMHYDEAAQSIIQKLESEELKRLQADRNRVPVYEFGSALKKVAKKKLTSGALLTMMGLGLLNAPDAKAATGKEAGKKADDALNNWPAYARLLGAALLIHKFGGKAGKLLLKPNALRSNLLFQDTLNRIEALDQILGTDVAKQIWAHQGAIMNASFGIKIDSATRAQAMSELRNGGRQALDDALSGTPGTVFENIPKDVRRSLVDYQKIQTNLKGLIDSHLEDVELFAQTNESLPKNFKSMVDALHYIKKQLGPQERTSDFEDLVNKGMSNFMDYHFYLNPAHHLTNLTDMFISGGARVGPMNLLRSIKLLAPGGNAGLKELMRHSNLTGGFEAEQLNTAVAAGKKGFKIKDFGSDKINADRVALGAVLQYAQTKGKALGWEGSDVQFAEDLFSGKLNPEVAVDAYTDLAEKLSRTLGVDPLKVNTDILSSTRMGKYMAVFVKQPARVSNLLVNYLANGQNKQFYMMLGAMALVGGRAALPSDAGYLWENVDPESYFAAAAMLDKLEVYQHITGKTISPKVQWALVAPTLSSSDPLRTTATGATKNVFQAFIQAANGELPKDKAYAALGGILSVFAPRIGMLPSKQALNLIKAGNDAFFEDIIPVNYYDQLGFSYGAKDEFTHEELNYSPLKQFGDAFIPGEPSSVSQAKMAKREEKRTDNVINLINSLGGHAKAKEPYFSGSEIRQKDPLSWLMRPAK